MAAQRSRQRERGSAIVEFALILPVLTMLLLGMLTGGMALFHKQQVTSAAREAARYGATVPEQQCATPSDCGGFNWAQLVQAIAVERANGDLAAAGVCVALVSGPGFAPVAIDADHSTAGGVNPCYVDNSSDAGKRVQVSVSRADRLEALMFNMNLQLNQRATARFEQGSPAIFDTATSSASGDRRIAARPSY